MVYESLLVLALVLLVGLLFQLGLVASGTDHDAQTWRAVGPTRQLLQIIEAAAIALYLCLSWRRGQTLAMRAWRLRLVRALPAPDTPPSLARCLARLVLATLAIGPAAIGLLWLSSHGRDVIAWIGVVPAGAALAWALIDRDRQTLYDRLAGTRLIVLPPASRR
jgi:uncharacterized RDD family membrane protein YckC